MKRKITQTLLKWYDSKARKPLILKGVRQVGKTYALRKFAETQFANFHYVNFEKESLDNIFAKDLNPKRIINEISFHLDADINIEKDLVIFDEIQSCPRALTSLKYFCEDMPELALCCAGSLLGLHLGSEVFPVGKVDIRYLKPLGFMEFLSACDDTRANQFLLNHQLDDEIPLIVHEHLWQRLLQYFITGGLPEVVSVFAKQQDKPYLAFTQIRHKQDEIINAYYADVAKHAGKVNAMHIQRVFQATPKQLSQVINGSSKRFQFSGIIPGIDRYQRLASVFDWLKAVELVLSVPIVNTAQLPFSAYTSEHFFKLFMFDVGLLGAMCQLSPELILQQDYGTYKGYFAENYIAQALTLQTNQPIVCWQEKRAEVEFLYELAQGVVPIEVKSGNITRAKSLSKFIEKYHPAKSIIFSARTTYIDKQRNVNHYPMYLAELLFARDHI